MSSKTTLPDTLSQRVQYFREQLSVTPNGLAQKAQIPLDVIEDIEAGLITFMAPAVRQKLARALRIKSGTLEEVEKRPERESVTLTPIQRKQMLDRIVRDPFAAYDCPQCGSSLRIQYFERRDLEDNPVTAIKVNCTRCLFRMDTD